MVRVGNRLSSLSGQLGPSARLCWVPRSFARFGRAERTQRHAQAGAAAALLQGPGDAPLPRQHRRLMAQLLSSRAPRASWGSGHPGPDVNFEKVLKGALFTETPTCLPFLAQAAGVPVSCWRSSGRPIVHRSKGSNCFRIFLAIIENTLETTIKY